MEYINPIIRQLYENIENGKFKGRLALIADAHRLSEMPSREGLESYLNSMGTNIIVGLGDWEYSPEPLEFLDEWSLDDLLEEEGLVGEEGKKLEKFLEEYKFICGIVGRESYGQTKKVTSNITLTHGDAETLTQNVHITSDVPYLIITGHEHKQYIQRIGGERIEGKGKQTEVELKPGEVYIICPGLYDKGELAILDIDGKNYKIILDKIK